MEPDNSKDINLTNQEALEKIAELEYKLLEARNLIYAIRHGEVDALLMNKNGKAGVYSLENIDYTYRVLVEKFAEGALSISKEGLILYCNSYFSDLINIPISKIVGSYFGSYLSNVNVYTELLNSVSEGRYKGEINLEVQGKTIPVYISVTSLEPNLPGFGIILSDQTDKKKSEKIILANQQQLEEKIKELNYNQNKLSQANIELAYQNEEKAKLAEELIVINKNLTVFTYISSHDLQEPLRKIQNFVEYLLKKEEPNLSPEGKGYFNRMNETAKRMQALIEDMLTYSRAKNTEHNFEKSHLDIVLEDVKSNFEELILEKKAQIKGSNLCEANIIPFQFRQLIFNLVGNSLKFAKPNVPPRISIKCKIEKGSNLNVGKLIQQNNYCHIIYTDNGIGFDPQYNERIFEVFQRLHSYEKFKGTGIGLAICKRIVGNHKGIITATGQLNKGARFDIYIPAE